MGLVHMQETYKDRNFQVPTPWVAIGRTAIKRQSLFKRAQPPKAPRGPCSHSIVPHASRQRLLAGADRSLPSPATSLQTATRTPTR
jgi:hypothetical protein